MDQITVLICNREKYDEKTADFNVLCLTLPMPKDILIEKMKNLNAKYTLILSYTITGDLENMKISSYSNIFGLNQIVHFFPALMKINSRNLWPASNFGISVPTIILSSVTRLRNFAILISMFSLATS